MKAYSMDLRERIVAACGTGQRVGPIAHQFGVSERTVRVYKRLAREGHLAPRPIPGKPPRLRADQEGAFVAMLQESPNWTLAQLCEEWERRSGVLLPRSTLHDHLKRLGGRYKKRVASPENATK